MSEKLEAVETSETENTVVEDLGRLPDGAILYEADLARIFGRHPATIRRAIQRRELPPGVRLLGRPAWTAGSILTHIEERLDRAKREVEKDALRISRHSP